MITLFIYWIIGVGVGLLVDAVIAKRFTTPSVPNIVLQAVLGLLAAYFLNKGGLNHWSVGAVFLIVGFLSFHVVQFLVKKKS